MTEHICKHCQAILEWINDMDEELVLANGFTHAFIGFAVTHGATVAVYDAEKCVDILMERDGMSQDEAIEFFEFNVAGAYVGEKTPLFLYKVHPLGETLQ